MYAALVEESGKNVRSGEKNCAEIRTVFVHALYLFSERDHKDFLT